MGRPKNQWWARESKPLKIDSRQALLCLQGSLSVEVFVAKFRFSFSWAFPSSRIECRTKTSIIVCLFVYLWSLWCGVYIARNKFLSAKRASRLRIIFKCGRVVISLNATARKSSCFEMSWLEILVHATNQHLFLNLGTLQWRLYAIWCVV